MRDKMAAEWFFRANVRTWLYSSYLASSLTLTSFSRILDELSSDLRGRSKVVIGGDFNAWAEDLVSLYTKLYLEAIGSLDIVLLNEVSQNTFNRAGVGSIIDLSFASKVKVSRRPGQEKPTAKRPLGHRPFPVHWKDWLSLSWTRQMKQQTSWQLD